MKMKLIFRSLFVILVCVACAACSTDDDIDEIFIGKTWYMSGGKLNGTDFSKDEVSSLYVNKDSYWIVFSNTSFNGKLSAGTSFSGTWTADGDHRSLKLNITSQENCEEMVLDRNIFHVLKNVCRYKGDANILEIFSDDDSYINLGAVRTINH